MQLPHVDISDPQSGLMTFVERKLDGNYIEHALTSSLRVWAVIDAHAICFISTTGEQQRYLNGT